MAYRNRASSDDGTWIVGLFFIILWCVGGIGWIWNVVKIVGAASEPITAMFIIRCVGAFLFPIGAVLGYF